ncbi:MAG: type II toxin-antitoxin system VapC family toxin, partial [Armatimonadetes bacterium]|nr:type II toxin-antitoxin system VapC family toxin [Armatimonadota bacterium]
MVVYLDSSALVKRYLLETGSTWLEQLLTTADDVYLSRITVVEVTAAIARRTPRPASPLLQALRSDLPYCVLLSVGDAILAAAETWAEQQRL